MRQINVMGLFRRKNHGHEPTFGFWLKFYLCRFLEIFLNPGQQICTPVHMGHFSASKTDSNFHLIAAVEEFRHSTGFDQIIMRIDIGPHFDLFDLLGLLALLIGRFFLLGFETHFTIVEDFADRKVRIRRHFHQI